jgi:hypothetical protein
VSEQVSSLKQDNKYGSRLSAVDGIGIENGSFKWNEIEEENEVKAQNDPPTTAGGDSNISPELTSLGDEGAGHRFELTNINVMFPDGRLTLVTGPTASGKTALLVSSLYFALCGF